MMERIKEYFIDSVKTISPVLIIVLLLQFFIPIDSLLIKSFVLSSILLIIGSSLFTFGADLSMVIIGNKIGKDLVESKKIWLILIVSFIIGTVVTIAEPDLLVLASQFNEISSVVLIIIISLGVGLCLLLASLRSLFGLDLNKILIIFFAIIFAIMFFVREDFIPLAFDSGGVTTGTISIPFIVTLGIGLVSNRIDNKAKEESFGLISLASTGPILMVLLIGLFFKTSNTSAFDNSIYTNISFSNYLSQAVISLKDVLLAILPILVVFVIYNFITRRVKIKEFSKIMLGIFITVIGLTIFLVAANVGFLNMGYYLGEYFAGLDNNYLLIPLIMIISFFIAIAEPAVIILIDQIDEFTRGNIPKGILKFALAIGVSIASGLSILRIYTGTSFIYYALVGYGIALLLMFFIPKVFTAIAFDSGGATGGSLTTAFLLPMAIGAACKLNKNVYIYAFGLASMVSLIPIITIEIVGIVYNIKLKKESYIESLDESIVDYEWEWDNG